MTEMQKTTQGEDSKVAIVKNFLEEILKFLHITSFNEEKIEKQAERIVQNKVILSQSVTKIKPKFTDNNAKFLFYLSEICARLSDKDSVLAIICIRINDEYERYFNEKKTPSINLKDPKVQKFLKFIFKYFSPQIGSTATQVSSVLPTKSNPQSTSKEEKSNVQESYKKGGILYEAFLNLENWSQKATDFSAILKNDSNIKKKYMKI